MGFAPLSFRVMMFEIFMFTHCLPILHLHIDIIICVHTDHWRHSFQTLLQKLIDLHPLNNPHTKGLPHPLREADLKRMLLIPPSAHLFIKPVAFSFVILSISIKIMNDSSLQLINTYTLECAYISSYKHYITLYKVIWKCTKRECSLKLLS